MRLERGALTFMQKRDVAFLLHDAYGMDVPESVIACLLEMNALWPKNLGDEEFVEIRQIEAARAIRGMTFLIDLGMVRDLSRKEVVALLENKQARARGVLATMLENGDEEGADRALSGEALEEHLADTLELRLLLYEAEQLKAFLDAHRWKLFARWQDTLTWKMPEETEIGRGKPGLSDSGDILKP